MILTISTQLHHNSSYKQNSSSLRSRRTKRNLKKNLSNVDRTMGYALSLFRYNNDLDVLLSHEALTDQVLVPSPSHCLYRYFCTLILNRVLFFKLRNTDRSKCYSFSIFFQFTLSDYAATYQARLTYLLSNSQFNSISQAIMIDQ